MIELVDHFIVSLLTFMKPFFILKPSLLHLQMQIYCFDVDQFSSFEEAVKGKGKIRALSILFEVIIILRFNANSIFESHEIWT